MGSKIYHTTTTTAMMLLFFFFFVAIANAQSATTLVPAIITFGDSFVDVGNNNYLHFAAFKANFPPYGRDFVNHSATGRFCNGKLAIDFIAETLGFASFPLPYLSPNASGNNLLIGANFASAGSGYNEKTANYYGAISLDSQLKNYKDYQSKLAKVAGSQNYSSIISKALYILSAGSDDYMSPIYISSANKLGFIYKQTADFSKFVQELYGLGARRIGVMSLPPLVYIPDITLFNNNFISKAIQLEGKNPGLKIAILDIYDLIHDLIMNPFEFGFTDSKHSCCYAKFDGCIPNSTTCSDPNNFVYWDNYHLSEAANRMVADSLLQDISNLIKP